MSKSYEYHVPEEMEDEHSAGAERMAQVFAKEMNETLDAYIQNIVDQAAIYLTVDNGEIAVKFTAFETGDFVMFWKLDDILSEASTLQLDGKNEPIRWLVETLERHAARLRALLKE